MTQKCNINRKKKIKKILYKIRLEKKHTQLRILRNGGGATEIDTNINIVSLE